MLIRAIIIDDETKGISTLKLLLEKYVADVKVVAWSVNPEEAVSLVEDYKPEVVFLDINMPGITGFEFLEKLQWRNFSLVFITAHQEYALRAIKNNAVDYLLKPVDYIELQASVAKVKTRINSSMNTQAASYEGLLAELRQNQKNKLLISLKSGIEAIETNELIYLESESNYTKLCLTGNRVIVTAKPLKDFEDQLCHVGLSFMRVHHSFIINLCKVTRYLKSEEKIILDECLKVPLSKSKREMFYSWLGI